jgi:hypothetical protein
VSSESACELLPELDRDHLAEKGYAVDVLQSAGQIHLIIRGFEFPLAYKPSAADLLIIVPAGYPNSQLDMFWTHPDVRLANGLWPAQAEYHEPHDGRSWQRWSRHSQQPWRPGVDCLRTFMAAIRKEIAKGI